MIQKISDAFGMSLILMGLVLTVVGMKFIKDRETQDYIIESAKESFKDLGAR